MKTNINGFEVECSVEEFKALIREYDKVDNEEVFAAKESIITVREQSNNPAPAKRKYKARKSRLSKNLEANQLEKIEAARKKNREYMRKYLAKKRAEKIKASQHTQPDIKMADGTELFLK